MPNKNYLAGRRFEYKIKREWEDQGYSVLRTAGSHGAFDLIAYRGNKVSVCFIQCKIVATEREAERMLKEWKHNPPCAPLDVSFNQCLEVWVRETRLNMRVIL